MAITTSDYLNQLRTDKQDLVDNLTEQGIEGLTGDETFTELVPKVLDIQTGGGDLDWNALGLQDFEDFCNEKYQETEDIKNNWNSSISSMYSKYEGSSIAFFPTVDVSHVTNFSRAFYNCKNLLMTGDFVMPNCTNINNAFYSCTSIVSIGNLSFTSVSNSSYAFNSCSNLKEIKSIQGNFTGDMGGMFSGCSSLKVAPLLNTSGVTTVASMFANCSSLETIPQYDTGSVKSMAYMFNGSGNLKNVPVLDTSSVTNFQWMFRNVNSLTDESLNNILQMCINATNYTGTKTLSQLSISSSKYPASKIQSLSNYQDFINAGWTIGY